MQEITEGYVKKLKLNLEFFCHNVRDIGLLKHFLIWRNFYGYEEILHIFLIFRTILSN